MNTKRALEVIKLNVGDKIEPLPDNRNGVVMKIDEDGRIWVQWQKIK